jgi:hypothetical protein
MTSEGLGEVFKGDFTDTYAGKCPLVLMGGRMNPSSVRRRGARTPIGASNKFIKLLILRCTLTSASGYSNYNESGHMDQRGALGTPCF